MYKEYSILYFREYISTSDTNLHGSVLQHYLSWFENFLKEPYLRIFQCQFIEIISIILKFHMCFWKNMTGRKTYIIVLQKPCFNL